MLASALRTYRNRFAVAPSRSVVIATNNDSAYQAAFDLSAAGIAVTMADARRVPSADMLARAAQNGIAIFPNCGIANVVGSKHVKQVRLSGARGVTIDCDAVGMSGGWSPNVHLTSHGGVKPIYRDDIAAFVPGELPKSQLVAGACTGTFGTLGAIAEGERAAQAAVARLGAPLPSKDLERPGIAADKTYLILPVWSEVVKGTEGVSFVDFQNDVSAKDVRTA
jgi:sarcosine oxidase subunit alpha